MRNLSFDPPKKKKKLIVKCWQGFHFSSASIKVASFRVHDVVSIELGLWPRLSKIRFFIWPGKKSLVKTLLKTYGVPNTMVKKIMEGKIETHTAGTKENITLTILSAIDLRISTTQSFTNRRINGGLGRLRKIFSHWHVDYTNSWLSPSSRTSL